VPNGYAVAKPAPAGATAVRFTATAVALRLSVPQVLPLPPWHVKLLALVATKLRVPLAVFPPVPVLRVSMIRHAAIGVQARSLLASTAIASISVKIGSRPETPP